MNELQTAIEKAISDGKIAGYPTLKAFAMVVGINPIRLYTVAKRPVEHEVYNSKVYNWDEIQKFLNKRLDPDNGYGTIEDVVDRAIEREYELRSNDRRLKKADTTRSDIVVDGKVVPPRKFPIYVNDVIKLKDDVNNYRVVYITDTHVVLVKVDTPLVSCFSNWTINNRFERKVV